MSAKPDISEGMPTVQLTEATIHHRLQEALYHLGDLFENAPEAYIITNAAGQVRRVNRLGRELLGAPPGFVEHKPLTVFVPIHLRREFRRVLARVALAAERCEWEGTLVGWNRSERRVACSLTSTRYADGTVSEVHWIIRQIGQDRAKPSSDATSPTALRRARQLPARPVRAAGSVESPISADTLDDIAHDLRNPLWVIMDQAGFLAERLVGGEPGAVGEVALSLANLAVFSGDVIAALGEVSDFAAFRSGRPIMLSTTSADLTAVVHRVVLTYRGITEVHRIELDVDGSGARGFIGEWDEERLEYVLSNILSDALDQCAESSEIRLRLARFGSAGESRASVTLEYDRAPIRRESSPSPMPRADRRTRGRLRGELLGFSGARWLADQMGGTLERRDRASGKVTVALNLPFWPRDRHDGKDVGPASISKSDD